MGDPRDYYLELPDGGRPAPFRLPERIYPDNAWYNENRASNRIYHSIDGIEAVVIHATAGGSTAGALSWWKDPRGQASAHWIVPDEDEIGHGREVLAVVWETLAAWHVRNGATHPRLGDRKKINHWSVGIEVVNRQSGHDPFSDWQIGVTALIVRYCWAKYPNLRHVFSHAMVDPGRRSDPGSHFDWDRFAGLVLTDAHDPVPEPADRVLMAAVAEAPAPTEETASRYC